MDEVSTPRRGLLAEDAIDDTPVDDQAPLQTGRRALAEPVSPEQDAEPESVFHAHRSVRRRVLAPIALTAGLTALVSTLFLAPSSAQPDVVAVEKVSAAVPAVTAISRDTVSVSRSDLRPALDEPGAGQIVPVAALKQAQASTLKAQQVTTAVNLKQVSTSAKSAGALTRAALVKAQADAEKAAAAKAAAELAKVVSMAPCPQGDAVESGLNGNGVQVHRSVCQNFPTITAYGGYRAEAGSEHNSGHALDCMIPNAATGRALADWARATAEKLGVTQVIYAQHIWTTKRASEGWRLMGDRGSITANHYDHVHLSFS